MLDRDDTPPAMAGISLMDATRTPGGWRVHCPGCDASRVVAAGEAKPVLVHGDGACPVLRQVTAALEEFQFCPCEVRG